MDNPSAFPRVFQYEGHDEDGNKAKIAEEHEGMTLRDYFAGQAMQAYISKIPLMDSEGTLGKQTTRGDNTKLQEDIAESAYWMADAMLKERTRDDKG